MNEKIIKSKDIEICSESFGESTNPCILLIMGATASMIWWEEEFCVKLSEMGYFVIRYDNRDTGRSTCYEPGEINYSVPDLVDDAISVLDVYNIKKAHFVGMSLGGMISQLAEIIYPERVLTLTLISSSVWDDRSDLPPIDEKVLNYHKSAGQLDWTNESDVVEYLARGWKVLTGSKYEFDLKRYLNLSGLEVKRAKSLLSMFNHSYLGGGVEYYGKYKNINKPVLIFHGNEDPVLPLEHAKALHNDIKNSKLIELEGIGHELNSNEFDIYIDNIVRHIKNSDST